MLFRCFYWVSVVVYLEIEVNGSYIFCWEFECGFYIF